MSLGLAAMVMAGSVFLSRFMGLIRDKVISYYHGAGGEADIYFTSFVVPDFINYLLAGGYFSITLIPMLAGCFARDEDSAWRLFSAVFWWVIIISLVFTSLAALLADPLAQLIGPGYTPELQTRLAFFLRIILPAQVFFLPGACLTAILYIRRQFMIPALTPLVYNGAIILGGLFLADKGMEGLCWGVLAGAFLGSFVLPLWAVWRGGLRLGLHFRHSLLPRLVLLALPLMLGQSLVALDEQFARIFGSISGEGAVSLLNYARRIMQVPVGVVAQAAGVASYPFLAALAASGERDKFDSSLNQALINTVLVALPLSLWMLVSAEPIMRLIFQQGHFTAGAASQSGVLLAIMLVGVSVWAVQQVVGRAFYAHQDTFTPALAGTGATLAALPVYWFGAKIFGAAGVAVAGLWGVLLYAGALCLIWRKRFGGNALSGLGARAGGSLMACLPACAAAYAAMSGVGRFWPELSLWGAACKIGTGGLAFALVYLLLCLAFAPALCAPLRAFATRARKRLPM